MSSFGEALASLYQEMASERSERAKEASERREQIGKLTRDTQDLLSQFAANQNARAEDFKVMAQDLRARLSASTETLKADVAALKAEAQQEAERRASRRAETSKDLHTRLATFSDTLQKDMATQFDLARKAHAQAQNLQDLAASAVETTVQQFTRPTTKSARKPTSKQEPFSVKFPVKASESSSLSKKAKDNKDQ